MTTELMIPGHDAPLQVPPARNKAAESLARRLDRLAQILAKGIDAKPFLLGAIVEVNKLPSDVDPESTCIAVFNAGHVGLPLGPALGLAYLVPFKKKCQLIIGYRGFLDLAYGGGFLRSVQADVVLEGEPYRRWNDANGAQIEHELPIDRDLDYKNVRAAYCIWQGVAGGSGVTVVGRKELDAVRRKQGNVWDTNPIEMALKTPIRRAAKRWKLTPQLAGAVMIEGEAEAGLPQTALVPDDSGPARPSLADLPDPDLIAKAEKRAADFVPAAEAATDESPPEAIDVQGDEAGPFDDDGALRQYGDKLAAPDCDIDAIETNAARDIRLTEPQRKAALNLCKAAKRKREQNT